MSGVSKPDGAAVAQGAVGDLLAKGPKVINVGLIGFAHELQAAGAPVVHVAWTPPARGDAHLAMLLGKLGS